MSELGHVKKENEILSNALSYIARERPIQSKETLELVEVARTVIMELSFTNNKYRRN